MVTIHHLEVHLDVEGDGEEAAFRRLFEKHMRQYRRLEMEAEERRRRGERERRLDGGSLDEGEGT
jgi:hypothetical protein